MTLLKERVEIGEQGQEHHLRRRIWPVRFDTLRGMETWVCDLDDGPHQVAVDLKPQPRHVGIFGRPRGRLTFVVSSEGKSFRVIPRKALPSKSDQAFWRFVKRINKTEGAIEIRRLEEEDGITVWTVTTAPLVDFEALEPIYEAEIEAMQSVDYRDGNTIRLQTKLRSDGDVEVAVIDNGCGVSDAVAKNLFTPFSTTKDSGLGMGLAISRAIITAHGGHLDYYNNDSGGATFFFTLPAASETPQPRSMTATSTSRSRGAKIRGPDTRYFSSTGSRDRSATAPRTIGTHGSHQHAR